MIVFLSVIFSTTTASVESKYLKEVSVIASVDSATTFNDSLPSSLLAPYEHEINKIMNIGKYRFMI